MIILATTFCVRSPTKTCQNFDSQIFLYLCNSLSSIICDIAMYKLESDIIDSLAFQIPLFTRYVDNILLLVPDEDINEMYLLSSKIKIH